MKKLFLGSILSLVFISNCFASKDLCTQVISTAEPNGRIDFTYNVLDDASKNYIGILRIQYELKDESGATLKQSTGSHKISNTSKKLTLEEMISAIKAQIGNICTYVAQDKLELAGETYQCS